MAVIVLFLLLLMCIAAIWMIPSRRRIIAYSAENVEIQPVQGDTPTQTVHASGEDGMERIDLGEDVRIEIIVHPGLIIKRGSKN